MGARQKKVHDFWNGKCVYCDKHISKKQATLDHWVPKRDGGLGGPHNYVLACQPCNVRKGCTEGYVFKLGLMTSKNDSFIHKIHAVYLTNKWKRDIENQLKENVKRAARNAHQNRLTKNLQPQA